ncbi:alanine racemase [Geotalea daltonii FRC-32]|uniref:Alanine racemase n=1 Tax=Geotalea daltonii (strain DSM 22248 / JCM 15807 / FRC-32) TaxID=316067 RepID=B9M4Q3_GEODF|nr:alanine racemase [Geotalea daltonii]ACM19779.2 alanine racemase [Geotalea daltonii FRC-32]
MDSRPTIAEIDLSALRHNFLEVKKVARPGCGLLAVVKADAYGHGFMDISLELESLGVTAFGVAFLAEGIQLRKSGIDRPILILGGIYPGQEKKCVGFNISTAVFSLEQAKALDETARKLYRKAKVHLKVDTGMGRLGVTIAEAGAFLRELRGLKNIELEGIFSHFASADELDESGNRYTAQQAEIFALVLQDAKKVGFSPTYVHIANSAAAFSRDLPFCNLMRPGIVLYGALPSADFKGKIDVKPVMRLKSRVAMLKWVEQDTSISYARRYVSQGKTLVASVPVGYADGYDRGLTNKGEALIRGQRARVAGTVCMDWIMLDVTHIPGVQVGDEVTLLGCDGQGNCIHAEELAELAGTIPYEIFCGISKRVPRVYI